MTELYSERLHVRRPPELVALTIAQQLGPPDGTTRSSPQDSWTVSRLAGLYIHEVTLDPDSGTMSLVVRAPDWVGALSVTSLLTLPAVAAVTLSVVSVPATAIMAALWAAAGLALLPVAPIWPDTPISRPDLGSVGETVHRQLSMVAVPPYLAVCVLFWLALQRAGAGPVATVALGIMLAVGGGIYYAAHGHNRSPGRDRHGKSDRTDTGVGSDTEHWKGISAIGLAVSALAPPLVTGGNLIIAGWVIGTDPPGLVRVVLAVAFVVGLDVVFLVFCRVTLQRVKGMRIAHVRSRMGRIAGIVIIGIANVTLVAGTLVVGWFLVAAVGADIPPTGVGAPALTGDTGIPGAFTWLPWPGPPLAIAGFYGLAALPLLVTAAGWVAHIGSSVVLVGFAVLGSDPVAPQAPLGEDIFVRVGNLGGPVVRPLVIGPWRFVLVDRTVRASLKDDEFAAVLAHEAYHLQNTGPATSHPAGIASLAVGGRNALLAFFDYPAMERAADDYAAEVVGTEPVLRALRRLEGLRYEQRPGVPSGRSDAVRGFVTVLSAPARLYFGPVLLDRAHRAVDERIERLTGRTTDPPGVGR